MMKPLVMILATCFFASGLSYGQEKTAKEVQKLSKVDNLLITVQKICPVMGAKLGSMGTPIKTTIENQTVFLCCKGCVGKTAKKEHWKTIMNNFAKAQKTCPIMDQPVDSSMESVVVDGKRFFICCPPCSEKIKNDPKTAWKKVQTNYVKTVLTSRKQRNDLIQINAQKICPVTGQKLGSMGKPIKVKVGKEHIFLCCKGCKKRKLDAVHWKTVKINLASAQGICPVMKKPITAESESVFVGGRRIFICCPPCKEKIEKSPKKFIAQLNAQIIAGGKSSTKATQK